MSSSRRLCRAPPAAAGGAVSGDCTGLTPQKCSAPPDASGNAAFECAGKRDHCCSNTKCAGYCRPWQKCDGNGGCDDTAALCTDRDAPRFSKSTPKFCSFQGQEESFCVGKRTKTAGWCCLSGETCGATFGKCTCDGGYCRDTCCGKDEVCRNERPDCVATRAGRSARPARQAPSNAATRRRRVASTSRRSRQPVVAERHDTVRRGLLRSEEGRALLSGQS